MASEQREWEQAFELVAANYRTSGLVRPGANGLYFTPSHTLPETIVLVAHDEQHLVATFTCVLDNWPLGVPLAELFPEEIDRLRQSGRRVGEVTSHAARDLGLRERLAVLRTMMKLGMQWHARGGGDTITIIIPPRHRAYYTQVLGFLPLGPCRPCPHAQGAPGEAFWVDWEQLKAGKPDVYQEVFGAPLPDEALMAPPMPRDLVRELDRRAISPSGPLLDSIFAFVDRFGGTRRW
jgi:hypothetical protein